MELKFYSKERVILNVIFLITFSIFSFGQTNTWDGSSSVNWNTAANWSLNLVPTSAHDVVIPDGFAVTVNTAAVCNSFTISSGNTSHTVTIASPNSLTVTNAVTIQAPTQNNRVKTLDVSTGTLTCGSVVMAATTANTRDCRLIVSSGVINVLGNITMGGLPTRNQVRINGTAGASGTLNIGGTISGGDLLSNNNNSIVNFNGTLAQVMPINVDYVYNNVRFNNAAGVTLGGAITATNVTVGLAVQSGIFDNGGFAITGGAGDTFSVSNGAKFNVSGTTSAFPSGYTVSLGATSTVEYNGSGNQTVFDVVSPGYGNLIFNNAIKTSAGDLDVQGNFNVQSGTFNNGGFSVTGVGNTLTVANGATLQLAGTTSAFPTGFTTNTLGATSTVEYLGTGLQTVTDVASPGYGNLTITNNSVKTMAASALDIQGNVTINNTATLAATAFTHNVGGSWLNSGSFTAGTSTVNFNSTTTGNTISGTLTGATGAFNNLTFDGIGGEWTLGANAEVLGSLTVTNGTFNTGGFALTGGTTFTLGAGSTYELDGATSSMPTGFATISLDANSTVVYKGTGVQTVLDIAAPGYGNLTFDGIGGSWTVSSDMDVANLLNVTNGSLVMNNTFNIAGNGPITIGAGATFTLNNNACIIQSGYTGANTGNIIHNKNSTPIIAFDYTYWSSPTSGSQTLSNFSPLTLTDKFFVYNNAWTNATPGSTTFTPGLGYAIRNPEGISLTIPAISSFQFTGVPNNGNIDVPVTLDGGLAISNRLIGNPYPSTLDADAFIAANLIGSGTINQTISGTLYFWTHNHSLTGNNYSSSDYATYTLLGGTAVATGTGNTSAPTQNIASCQGFFIHTLASGNVSFRNSMRLGTNNTNFYRTSNGIGATKSKLESHRLWLNLTNSTSSFSQILIGYIQTATNGVDPGFDGLYYGSDKHVLYTLINNDKYTINARALPFSNNDLVPIGYRTNVAGQTTITLDKVDGLFLNGQKIYINDNKTNTIHCISDSPYIFESEAGEFNDRFVLQYVDYTLSNESFVSNDNLVDIVSHDNQINFISKDEYIKKIEIYDLVGRLIVQDVNVNKFDYTFFNNNSEMLIVKVLLSNNQSVIKKILH